MGGSQTGTQQKTPYSGLNQSQTPFKAMTGFGQGGQQNGFSLPHQSQGRPPFFSPWSQFQNSFSGLGQAFQNRFHPVGTSNQITGMPGVPSTPNPAMNLLNALQSRTTKIGVL